MGFFISLLCVCFGAYLAVLSGVKIGARFYRDLFLQHKELMESTVLYTVILIGLVAFSLMGILPFEIVTLWGLGGFAILAFAHSKLSQKQKIFWELLLCFSTALGLYPLSGNFFPSIFLLTFLWWGIWRMMVWFDRFSLLSILVTMGWTIGLVTTGLIMQTFPVAIVALVSLIGVTGLAISSVRISGKSPVWGHLSASLICFMWAGIWSYFLLSGAIIQTTIAFGYYIFEFFFIGMAFFYHRPIQTFLEHSLESPFASKAVGTTFSHILILSFFAAMTMHMSLFIAPILIFILGIVLVDLYLRLNSLENPVPTWRELFKNTRQGIMEFVGQIKQVHPTKKVVLVRGKAPKKSLKKVAISKKTPVSRKKVQKTPIKKKTVKKRKTKK